MPTRASSSKSLVVYTDGACSGNPGPGGWAWAIDRDNFASGFSPHTTNQRMEIQAAYEAVRALTGGAVEIVSDSTYVVNCFKQRWWRGWLDRGWLNSQRKPVANRDLWEPFIELVRARGNVSFRWVKGHGVDAMNDLVDQLAVEAVRLRDGRALGVGKVSVGEKAPRSDPPQTAADQEGTVVYLICGPKRARASSYAADLSKQRNATNFSIEDWMKTLFLPDVSEPSSAWLLERAARCEKQIWDICRQEIALGRDVVLNLGFERKEQRQRFSEMARSEGAVPQIHYVGVEGDATFEPPDSTELRNGKRVR